MAESQWILPIAAAAACALAYWLVWSHRDMPGRLGAAVKAASTGLLALVLARAQAAGGGWFWLMPLGLALGAAGDLFLALRGARMFLAGMAAFGAGHLAYAAGLMLRTAEIGFDGLSAAEWGALAGLLALVVSTEAWLAPRTGALRGAVRVYVALIGGMGLAVLLVPQAAGQLQLRVGAALFILSDFLLALRLFVVRDPRLQRMLSLKLWPAYWLGQLVIGWGAVLFWL
jgi:uncharacterized membrane protein YhhN